MGMVDCGADIGFLSQFPGEREILYGPLMGMEVRGTRVDGITLVIVVHISVNQKSLTLEQVLSKRRKVVRDMKDQMRLGCDLATTEWDVLREIDPGMQGAKRFLECFDRVAEKDPSYYNDDAQLGAAVLDAVALSKTLGEWPEALRTLAGMEQKRVADLLPGEDAIFRPMQLELPVQAAQGIAALSWAAAEKLTTLDLSGRSLLPASLEELVRALPPTLETLSLRKSDITAGGKNRSGFERLCLVLAAANCPLRVLDLQENGLGPDDGRAIAKALDQNAVLSRVE